MSSGSATERISVFVSHIAGIFLSGRAVLGYEAYSNKSGDMSTWGDEDLDLVIANGRAQLARQGSDLEAVRGRAQYLLTLAIALMGAGVAIVPLIVPSLAAFLLWSLGLGALLIASLGAGGVIAARKSLGLVDTRLLSQQRTPVRAVLARAVTDAVGEGENTVATEITVFRDAVAALLCGFALVAVAWCVAVAG